MGGLDAVDGLSATFESPLWQVARGGDEIDCLVIGSGTAGVALRYRWPIRFTGCHCRGWPVDVAVAYRQRTA